MDRQKEHEAMMQRNRALYDNYKTGLDNKKAATSQQSRPSFWDRLLMGNFAYDTYPEKPSAFPAVFPPAMPDVPAIDMSQFAKLQMPEHLRQEYVTAGRRMPAPAREPMYSAPPQQQPQAAPAPAYVTPQYRPSPGMQGNPAAQSQAPAAQQVQSAWQRFLASGNNQPTEWNPTYTER